MLTLYIGNKNYSSWSMRPWVLMKQAGVPFREEKIRFDAFDTDSGFKATVRKLNPAGAVPVLEEDGWALTQNAAILNYLADRFPESGLGGDGTPRSRAEVNRWLAFVNSDVHPAFKPLFGATSYLEDEAAIGKSKDAARRSLRGLFERADAQLAGRDWLAGDRSIADPFLYVVTRWAKAQGVDLSGLDNLARFVGRMESDAAVRKVLADEGLA